ncbi:hypothetical protein BD410DRAFT_541522 [Rickenella mellea]|uniref:Cytosolic endo-beta-N-acetylglucosaminidase TIM barrel domain-containing protein n=1 Tax=Rickenella mellea TaxID=50990 RepID=A0A4Y7PRA1_9AGAM|nr:hypothetical protein BD410DRAFT_541522 [Rickenella mellea]
MPLKVGNKSLRKDSAPYFKSLAELDDWSTTPRQTFDGVLQYHPRSSIGDLDAVGKGKLLVCHDYKGGYTEDPLSLCYTFNFWDRCDTFIYFSHHAVTVPPPGWINAAHRQGVKMLGTLIFEGSGEEDCLRLLVGKLPKSTTGPAEPSSAHTLPLSPHYARLLAELAVERGFDGYLLNFECPLRGGPEQMRALDAWITILDSQLKRRVGSHSQAIWYDSVIITGQLRWQDRLNSLNLPFFLSSTSFFTNYTWPTHFPSLCAQYLLSLPPELLQAKPKTLQDIFIGVDVWGRGSHGGGGFGSFKAIEHADPQFLGLSVAVFGPAWTWESEQDKPGFDWDAWWAYERLLWLGPSRADDHVPTTVAENRPQRAGEPPCDHAIFKPLSSFFVRQLPPDPVVLPLLLTFCPGVGHAWFVEGRSVLQVESGWTDIDKQTSLGDLVWPRPDVHWEGDQHEESPPEGTTALDFRDAWTGGSSLRLTLTINGSDTEDAAFRYLWIPIQSLALTPGISYDAIIVYKIVSPGADVDLGLSVKETGKPGSDLDVQPIPQNDNISDLPFGWSRTGVTFMPASRLSRASLGGEIGIVVGIAPEDPTSTQEVTIQIGQVAVYATPPADTTAFQPRILWADISGPEADGSRKLTWDICASFTPIGPINIGSSEDPKPAWMIDHASGWFPSFSYFNIYAQVCEAGGVFSPENAGFIGTTGMTGVQYCFEVERGTITMGTGGAKVRLYVQGVTDRGEVLPWAACAFVDIP